MKKLLVTGSSGLIGSEVVAHFSRLGWKVYGIDNNQRADFFGPAGDTRWNQKRMIENWPDFEHIELDIRDWTGVQRCIAKVKPDLVVHAAAQPSHDLAAQRPLDDFDTNAVGTMNLLEACRQWAKETVFVFMSTNKLYGDRPNQLKLVEKDTRYDYAEPNCWHGIAEDFPIDQSIHSIFGVSKTAADLMVQEYGRYFGLHTVCLRCGCLTGPNHAGVELHGFLSYLVKCNVYQQLYTIYGYKGKQVRDNIHSYDVATLIENIYQRPKCGEVYNVGGGRDNSLSIIEAICMIESITGQPMLSKYCDQHRLGDHIVYISDISKVRADYPQWHVSRNINSIISELIASWQLRKQS